MMGNLREHITSGTNSRETWRGGERAIYAESRCRRSCPAKGRAGGWENSRYKILQFLSSLMVADVLILVCSVQFSCSVVAETLCDPMNCSTPGLPVHHQLPEFTETHVHWVGDASSHLIICRPLLLLHSIFPSIRIISNESALQVAKVLEFQLHHQSFQWTPRTDLFRMDWLDLLAVQGTLKSLLQHHSSKASILQHSAFFIVQLSHPYMTIGKTIALTRRTFF